MKKFRYIEDIQDWLEPLNYQGFWHVIEPYNLVLQDRDHCDDQIAGKHADEDDVLYVLKHMAQTELAQRNGLTRRPITPWLKLVD